VKTSLDENINQHPIIHKYDLIIKEYNKEIADLHEQLQHLTTNYKKRMEHLKHLLKTDLNDVERRVVLMTIRDEKKEYGAMMKIRRKDAAQSEKILKESINKSEKKRTNRYNKLRKTMKNMIGKDNKQIKEYNRENKMLRKTIRHQKKDFEHDYLKNLVNAYRTKIVDDLVNNPLNVNALQVAKKEEKDKERELKKLGKQLEKGKKEQEKQQEKNRKQREREEKQQEKLKIRETKKRERETKQQTRKIK
jgi:hypothetical protein